MIKKPKQDPDFVVSREIKSKLSDNHLFSSSSAPWQQRIIRDFLYSTKISNPQCLDAACGVGNNIRTLLKLSTSIYAVDRSPRALEFAQDRYKEQLSSITFSIGELENLPFPPNTFDLILCTEALEHVRDVNAAIKELSRVLKPKGIIILSFQNYLNPSVFIKPLTEYFTGKNWDAWGTHNHSEGYERFLTYFQVKKALLYNKDIKIISVRGADYLNGWLGWVPGIHKNYDLLDSVPLLSIGRLPLVKIMGMDCFVLAKKIK